MTLGALNLGFYVSLVSEVNVRRQGVDANPRDGLLIIPVFMELLDLGSVRRDNPMARHALLD